MSKYYRLYFSENGTYKEVSLTKRYGDPTLGELRALFYDWCASLGYQVHTEIFDDTQEVNGTLKDLD